VVPRQAALLEAAFTERTQADAITSGGVSVGETDYTKAMMKKARHDDGVLAYRHAVTGPWR
jgi:molybdopterin biosynthesis enzyme